MRSLDDELRALSKADADLMDADARIQHQIDLIVELERDGHDTRAAKKLLAVFRETRAAMQGHRDLIAELVERMTAERGG
ncbi:hypothetical protein AWB76_06280 [Caballeronia temeraria]|uniref:Uncharacterized protein n=1 Tax=Caballeronia temeraria TaxID=1777137 RepID=A0A158D2P8_9BURK|nr:hypothetical protein [Caballeronia temeraria]SAK88097.1 hypothetical protein AWB76_06280 [Caballeronia temeraria]